MKSAKFIFTLVLLLNTSPLWAQNWVTQFLNRYRPVPAAEASELPSSTPQNLAEMMRAGALPLSVGDVVRLMLENNLDIRVDRFSPRSNEHLIDTLFRPFEPTLRLSSTTSRSSSPSRSQLDGAEQAKELRHSYAIGYGQTLQSGTSVGVDVTVNRNSSNSAFNTFNPSWFGTVRYSFNQPLLRNRGRQINTRGIRIAQNGLKMSEVQFEIQVIDLVVQAQRLYWDLVLERENQKVRQRSLDLAQKTLQDNRRQVEIGTLAAIEVVQAESEVASRQEQLVVTNFTEDQIEDRIKKLITTTADPGLVLAQLTPVDPVRRPAASDVMPLAEAIRVALENRPEMRQLAIESQNRDIDLAYLKNQLLPTMDIFGAYTQSGVGGTETLRNGFGPTAPIIAVNKGGLFDAFRQILSYDFTGYAVGFNVNIPLSNKAAQAEHARAVNEKRLTESRLSAAAQQIALEVRNAYSQVEMNRARIEAASKARELAERRLEAEQKKFQLGTSAIRFVLEEQRNLTVGQTNEIQALVSYTKAILDFERATGRTLQRQNIELQKALRPGQIAGTPAGAPVGGR